MNRNKKLPLCFYLYKTTILYLKKQNMLMKNSFFYLAIIIFLVSCDTTPKVSSKSFIIDNPTSATITVKIDEQDYKIPSNSSVTTTLDFGKHSMTYNGEKVNFFVKPNDQNCIINPTLSNYYLYHEIYLVKGAENVTEDKLKYTDDYLYPYVKPNGDTINVPFLLISNTLFIEQYQYYWHFDMDHPFVDINSKVDEKEKKLMEEYIKTLFKSKIFREHDFLEYVKDKGIDLPEGFIKSEKYKLSNLPAYEFIPKDIIDSCPLFKNELMNIKSSFDSLQIMTDKARAYKLISYELNNRLNDVRIGVIRQNKQSCDFNKIDILTKRKPSFGEMNAYIVK